MVGMVIVSHSAKVAEGIYELAVQLTGGNHALFTAAGLENGEIGTDALKIKEAIKRADCGEGVLVLADLGSSILSTQLAMELLEEECSIRVELVDAPILEGTISGAVTASMGAEFEVVKGAIEQAAGVKKL